MEALTMENCTVRRNTGSYGGGVSTSGTTQTNVLRNCEISHNVSVSYAGGMLSFNGYALIENCTIVSNRCASPGESFKIGGVLLNSASSNVVRNTIIMYNLYPSGVPSDLLYTASSAITYSCVFPVPAGDGNIGGDPMFTDLGGGDYTLLKGSPCINAGTNQPWMDTAKDRGGLRRLDVMARIVDIGCHEYPSLGTVIIIR